MNVRQATVLLMVALMIVPTVAVGSVNGSPDVDVSVPNDRVTPGEDTQLTVKLTNTGNLDSGSATNPALNSEVTTARGVNVTLKANDPDDSAFSSQDGVPFEVETGSQYMGQLPKGQSSGFAFDISVDDDAEPGTYETEVIVEYTYTSAISEVNGARNERTEKKTYDVKITVEDRAEFEIVDTETNVRIGSSGSVGVTMRNTGTENANDTTVKLESPNADLSFGQQPSATRYVGNWEPGETRTVNYQMQASQDAKEQSYALTATTTFDDSDGVTRQSNPLSLGVTPSAEQRFVAVDTESDVAVGDTGTVSLTMQNTGSSVTDAEVTLQSTSSDVVFGDSSSATRFVGAWESGETQVIEYDVTATDGADTRSYGLSASVNYEDPDEGPGSSRPVSVGVTPLPETEFRLSDVSGDLRVDEERTLSGTITNDGDTITRDVVVNFVTDNENVNPSETESSVGTLEPGESADFEFSVEISQSAESGPRQFTFTADYRNGDGDSRESDDLLSRLDVGPKRDTFDVEVVEGNLTSGGNTQLTVEVTNDANETLTDISAKLFADDPISVDNSEAFVSELGPGESETLTFSISASGAIPKSYPVEMDFQYDDNDGDTLVSDTYRLPVTVGEQEGGDGGNTPLILIGLGIVAIVGIGGYMRFR